MNDLKTFPGKKTIPLLKYRRYHLNSPPPLSTFSHLNKGGGLNVTSRTSQNFG